MNILVVVDMQNDFIDGSLGTKRHRVLFQRFWKRFRTLMEWCLQQEIPTEKIIWILRKAESFRSDIVSGRRTAWQIRQEIAELLTEPPIDKVTFGSRELVKKLEEIHEKTPIESITLIGLCTDICVISNALLCKAFLPEVPVQVDAQCCAGVTAESHTQALEAMRMCQIDIL